MRSPSFQKSTREGQSLSWGRVWNETRIGLLLGQGNDGLETTTPGPEAGGVGVTGREGCGGDFGVPETRLLGAMAIAGRGDVEAGAATHLEQSRRRVDLADGMTQPGARHLDRHPTPLGRIHEVPVQVQGFRIRAHAE